jgi:hypothetical protein
VSSPTVLPFISRAEENVAWTIDRTGDKINYIEVAAKGLTYRQTWTYTGDYVTSITAWVKQ